MADTMQIIYWIFFLIHLNVVLTTSSTEDLDSAEANGKLEIIKQIKKVNDDGSYTIGYEADDGSFKIESRDVLGNVKGTYGYIDEHGDIKRVSYSTNNGTEILPKPEITSVVQRIPKLNKTSSSSTTRRPNILYHTASTQSTPSSTPVVQIIPKRRITTSTTTVPTTTPDSKVAEFIKAAVQASKSTTIRPIYENASPRILLQQRALIRSEDPQKSEGQLIRPDVSPRPTEIPLYRRKTTLLDSEQRINNDEPTNRGNLLRRQLLPEKVNFDAKQHVLNLQQSHGDDVVDVYSGSLTTGTPRPLFTTSRPKFISSTIPPTIQRPTIRYPQYSKPKEDTEYVQESSTENIQATTTANPVPVVQIPANRESSEALVAIPHPVSGRTILVPLSQLQNNPEEANQYISDEQYLREFGQSQQNYQQAPAPVYLRRYNQPQQRFRAIPVRVDENGYIRQMTQYPSHTTPYPIPARIANIPVPDYLNNEEDINEIKPPVSTKDFQKLLEQLILRQSRLEQISYLSRRYQQMYGQRNRPLYRQNSLYQRRQEDESNMHYIQQQNLNLEQQNLYNYPSFTPTSESYIPTRRVARLLSSQHQKDDAEDSDFLPPDVREMLLLRMLQLAINPALPLDLPDALNEISTLTPTRHRKSGVRNVEILGEEDDPKSSRSKR